MSKKKYKLLIIDDSKAVLGALESEFSGKEYELKTTQNPLDAIEIIENEHVDIVISDIEMPEMNGLELLRKIKSFNGMVQVVIITGYITVNNTLNAFRYGARDLFFKPVDVKQLALAVAEAANHLDRVNMLIDEAVQAKEKKSN